MATQPRPKIKGAAPAPPTAISPQQLTERIRARAYELYEEHGKLEGKRSTNTPLTNPLTTCQA